MSTASASLPDHTDALIVGGGIAGLAAAAFLARSGHRVTLCERSRGFGGRARSQLREGFVLNMGPHALYRSGAGIGVLEELGIRCPGHFPPMGGALLIERDRTRPFPMGTTQLLTTSLLSLREKLAVLRLFRRLPKLETRALQTVTLDAWLEREGVAGNAAALIRTLIRLTSYCADSDAVSAGAVLEQLRRATHGVLYLDGGWQSLVDGLSARADEQGAELHWRTGIRGLQSQGAGVVATTGSGHTIHAKTAVLAVSPGKALSLLGDHAGGRLREFAASSSPVTAACLDIGLRALPRWSAAFALDLERPLYLSLHSASARLAPSGHHLFHLARYGSRDDAREELVDWMDRLQPGWRQYTTMERYIPRAPVMNALPRADQGGLPGRPGPGDSGCPAVTLCGDWVGDEGLLADAALASARKAAARVDGTLREQAA